MHSGSLEPLSNTTSGAFEDGRIKQRDCARTATILQKTMPQSRTVERARFLIAGGTDVVRAIQSKVKKASVAAGALDFQGTLSSQSPRAASALYLNVTQVEQ
jgi:hypothetical protein